MFCLTLLILGGCKTYKQDIMFRPQDGYDSSELRNAVDQTEKNYVIQVNDLLRLDVFTNRGERIIDPNFEIGVGAGGNQNMRNQQQIFNYLVQVDGNVKLPILGLVSLQGLTIQEAEDRLESLYNEFYKDSYVKLQYDNKRVIVLGATGGQVVQLPNENMSLVEVVALAGGVNQDGRVDAIRLIRGDLSSPQVFMVDLSTVEGMKASILNVEPGDVIYIEPRRRVFFEALRDITPILSLVVSLLTLALVIENLND